MESWEAYVAWRSAAIDLMTVKAIPHAHGATLNDLVMAAIGGALRRYLAEHGPTLQMLAQDKARWPRPWARSSPLSMGRTSASSFAWAADHIIDYTREDFCALGRSWDMIFNHAG